MSQLQVLKDVDDVLRAKLRRRDNLRGERKKHGNRLEGYKRKIERNLQTISETEDRLRSANERLSDLIDLEESKRKTVMALLTEAETAVAIRMEELAGLM